MEKHLSEPHFSNICSGLKTVEGRPEKGSFGNLLEGDIIIFYNDDNGSRRTCKVKVINVTRHINFKEMLNYHSLAKVLPNVKCIEEGVSIYDQWYKNIVGVIGIVIEKLNASD